MKGTSLDVCIMMTRKLIFCITTSMKWGTWYEEIENWKLTVYNWRRDVTHYTFENKHGVIGASDKLTINNWQLTVYNWRRDVTHYIFENKHGVIGASQSNWQLWIMNYELKKFRCPLTVVCWLLLSLQIFINQVKI